MWPKALIEEIASRRCIIFLGAGASAGCKTKDMPPRTPPTWSELLEGIKTLASNKGAIPIAEELINKDKYLDAAEILFASINPADFAMYIRETFAKPNYQESSIHQSVLTLDPKIVVTTNYDEIYDTYCKSGKNEGLYNTCKYYEDHLVSDLRSPVRQIIKAHGCLSDPSKIVLTRSQYFKERQNYLNFYQVLDALFLTNTLFFIGYGMADPDILLLLENSNITYKVSHPHYAFIQEGMNEILKQSCKEAYNLEFIEFPKGDFKAAEENLQLLVSAVLERRQTNPI